MGVLIRFSGWIALTGVSAFLLWIAGPEVVRNVHQIERAVVTPSAKIWVDEAAVVDPLMTYLNQGYWGYRCAINPWVGCYGNGQVPWDVLSLRISEKWKGQDWWRKESILPAHEQRWPWNLEFPRLGTVLLVSRAFAVALLAWFLISWGWHSTRNVFTGFALGVLWVSEGYFTASWQGIKNDFTAVLVLLWFLNSMLKIHSSTVQGKSGWRWFWALNLGIWASMIRLSNAAVFVAVFGMAMVYFSGRWKRLLGCAIVGILLILVWNPNFRMAGSEIRWISVFLSFLSDSAVARAKNFEAEWGIARTVLYPWFFAFVLCGLNFWRDPRAAWGRMSVLGVASGISFYLVWQGAYQRTHYYLVPWWVTGYWLILEFAAWKGPTRSWLVAGVLCLLQWTPAGLSRDRLTQSVAEAAAHWQSLRSLDWSIPDSKIPIRGTEWVPRHWVGRRLWLDLNLRLAVPSDWASQNQVVYFDSLAESPADLLQRGLSQSDWIAIPCWGKGVDAWRGVSRSFCKETRDLDENLLRPFLHGAELDRFKGVEAAELFQKSKGAFRPRAMLLAEERLKIRQMKGSWQGAERWDGPFFFQKSFVLTQEFQFARASQKMTWAIRSSLKEADAQAEVKIYVAGEEVFEKTISLDVSKKFCEAYSQSCRWLPRSILKKFQNWSERYFLVTEEDPIPVTLPAGKKIRLEIRGSWSPAKTGVVNLDDIQF